jgi:D-glycero-D-manno-heptose 1,7-bisphosphate phosphatase
MKKKRAIFLDRDGVININHGYVYQQENFNFVDGIFDLVKEANNQNYLVIVITNQAGIARGYYSENDFELITNWMIAQFSAKGCNIDSVYFSPYHPTQGIGNYLKDDISRKPNPGMILDAVKDFNINLNKSLLIGDKITDIQAGISAGINKNILFDTQNNQSNTLNQYSIISNLAHAKKYLSQSE